LQNEEDSQTQSQSQQSPQPPIFTRESIRELTVPQIENIYDDLNLRTTNWLREVAKNFDFVLSQTIPIAQRRIRLLAEVKYILNHERQRRRNMLRSNFVSSTLTSLRRMAREAGIRGSSTMNRENLISLLAELNITPTTRTTGIRLNEQQYQTPEMQEQIVQQVIPQQQNWWTNQNRCANDVGTLQSDDWADIPSRQVLRFNGNCFTVRDIYGILHHAFTATDTSYQVPPLRLQVPREPFARKPFTLDFFLQLRKKVNLTNLPTQPEVAYFLRHVRKFYAPNSPIHPFLTNSQNRSEMSRAIESFFLTTPAKNPGLQMVRQQRNIEWKFQGPLRTMTPEQLLQYVLGKKIQ
jgi:hypothetical protein